MQILFLSAWFPYPPNNGSKLRIWNLLRGLAQHHQITLITFTDRLGSEVPGELQKVCRKVYVIPARNYNARSLRAITGAIGAKPRVLVDRYQPLMARCIEQEVQHGKYDLVIASQWYTADYLTQIEGIPAIFEEVELGIFKDKVDRADGSLQRVRHQLTNLKMKWYFQKLLSRFSAVTVVSEMEKDLLHELVPGYQAVEVISNGVSLAEYEEVEVKPEPDSLIFTGSFRYFVNYQAMLWFLEKVYPQVLQAVPNAHLTITGDSAGQPLPASKNVAITGFVKDIRPLIASSWVSIAPILSGGGTRLKILEAMALRTPVIATSKGAEGLDAHHEEHLLVADTPEEFAEATIRLLTDCSLRDRLSANAYRLIREQYDWPVILPRFLNLIDRAVKGAAAAPGLPAVKQPHVSKVE